MENSFSNEDALSELLWFVQSHMARQMSSSGNFAYFNTHCGNLSFKYKYVKTFNKHCLDHKEAYHQ